MWNIALTIFVAALLACGFLIAPPERLFYGFLISLTGGLCYWLGYQKGRSTK